MRARRRLTLTVVGATAFTLLVSVTSIVHFAYRSPSLHVSVETAAALVSLLAAQLMYGRFRRSLDRRDLVLMASLVVFAGSNLLFVAVPAMANLGSGPFVTWAPTAGSVLATALLAAGAFAPPRSISRPVEAGRRVILLCWIALALIGLVTVLARDWLPEAIDYGLSPEAATRARIIGDPVVLGVQLVSMALFAIAAVGLAREADRMRDPLMLAFAIGATLGAFARLNYFLFPSLYSEYFYAGDVLRLGFFAALLAGGALEIRIAQRELEHAAVVTERRRLAREIHDGVAQDLAFLVQQSRALQARNGDSQIVAEMTLAARRALDESRGLIDELVRPTDEPLAAALARVADQAAGRWGSTVQTAAIDGLALSAPRREALLRIVGEAVTNAARHAHAGSIRVELAERPELEVTIIDDGIGFDPSTVQQDGHLGIVSMRERAEQVGAGLRVRSRPGEGTEIRVVLP
jgi:signal transduction histidine kinase